MKTVIVADNNTVLHTEVLSTDNIVVRSRIGPNFGIVAKYSDIPITYSIYLSSGKWDKCTPYSSIESLILNNNIFYEFFVL